MLEKIYEAHKPMMGHIENNKKKFTFVIFLPSLKQLTAPAGISSEGRRMAIVILEITVHRSTSNQSSLSLNPVDGETQKEITL